MRCRGVEFGSDGDINQSTGSFETNGTDGLGDMKGDMGVLLYGVDKLEWL